MMALAPTVSRAIALERFALNSDDLFWMEICSAVLDHKRAPTDTSGVASTTDAGTFTEPAQEPVKLSLHCPYCVIHVDVIGTLPQRFSNTSVATLAYFLPPLFYRSPQPLFAWTVASSRAPPLV